MAKHPTIAFTADQMIAGGDGREGFPTFYGVPVAVAYDDLSDAEHFIALGHHEPKRFLAAMLAYTRKHTSLDPDDFHLDRYTREMGEKAIGWHSFYQHADRVAVDEADYRAENWCVCNEYAWQSVQVAGPGDGNVPTMIWRAN